MSELLPGTCGHCNAGMRHVECRRFGANRAQSSSHGSGHGHEPESDWYQLRGQHHFQVGVFKPWRVSLGRQNEREQNAHLPLQLNAWRRPLQGTEVQIKVAIWTTSIALTLSEEGETRLAFRCFGSAVAFGVRL